MPTCDILAEIIDEYNDATTWEAKADILHAYDEHRDGCRICTGHEGTR